MMSHRLMPTAVTASNRENRRSIRHYRSRLNYFRSLSLGYHTTVNVLGTPEICFRGNWRPRALHALRGETKPNRYFERLLQIVQHFCTMDCRVLRSLQSLVLSVKRRPFRVRF